MNSLITHSQQIITSVEEEYWELRKSAGLYFASSGFLLLKGTEPLEFLQRLSTNDFSGFQPGSHITTVLTTEKAKIIDICTVLYVDNKVVLITSFDAKEKVKSWLEKYIIMEDIEVIDLSHEYIMISIIGPNAVSYIKINDDSNLYAHYQNHIYYFDQGVITYLDARFNTPMVNFVGRKQDLLNSKLLNNIIENIKQVGSSAYNIIRIEEGIPSFGVEITENCNPLEAVLNSFVSFTKGCYIGQEVIARLDTYKKLQKILTGFIFCNAHSKNDIYSGKLFSNNEYVGDISSIVWSFMLRKTIALGYLKTGITVSNLVLKSEDNMVAIPVEVSGLPFISA